MQQQYKAAVSPIAFLMETVYAWCITLTSWLIVTAFWIRGRSVHSLFQQYYQLKPNNPSVWPHVARVMLIIVPFLFNFLVYSIWYNIYRIHPFGYSAVLLVFLMSYYWLHILQVMPFIYYLIFGQLILDSLVANNNTLTRVLQESTEGTSLMQIHQRNVTIRRLYGELEQVVSLPLLGCKICITCFFTDTLFFAVTEIEENGISWHQCCCIIIGLLILVGTGVVCRIADNIKNQVKNVLKIFF